MRCRRIVNWCLLIGALVVVPASGAWGATNVLILCPHPEWLDAFTPLVQWLADEQDVEQHRPWEVECVAVAGSTATRELIRQRRQALGPGGGDLFVLLVADPSREPDAYPQRWLHDPAVAGANLGWGEELPVDDLYADLDDDGTLDAVTFRLPAWSVEDCQAYVAKDLAFRIQAVEQPAWLQRVDIVAEDYGRLGHSGDLVRRHGTMLQEIWSGWYRTVYTGDTAPFDYDQREATADSLDNLGHQFKITLGTEANKVNLIDFQDLRLGWSEDHLQPTGRCFFHLALSCAHHAVDRADHYGRPLAERFLFALQRGAVASLGFTRQGREWVHYWMGEALARAVIDGIHDPPACRTVIGRCWLRAQRTFRAEHPEHASEFRSFCGFGDPTLPVVWFSTPTAAPATTPDGGLHLQAAPNPFNGRVNLTAAVPAGTPVTVAIYDAAGRLVRRLDRRHRLKDGRGAWTWDGRDDRGREVAAGCYYVRLRAGNADIRRKVVYVK